MRHGDVCTLHKITTDASALLAQSWVLSQSGIFELRLQEKISHYQCMHGWLLLLREENISLLWRIKYFQTKIVRMMCDPDRRCIVSSDPAVWFCRALLSMYEKQLQKYSIYLSFSSLKYICMTEQHWKKC